MSTEPTAGMWLLESDWGIKAREIVAVTPKLFKVKSDWGVRQVRRDSKAVLEVVPTQEQAERLRDSIAGIYGEYTRRKSAAQADYTAREEAAREARDKAVRAVLSRALEGE